AEEVSPEKVREVYERAVAQVPPGNEKRHWRRYIFLWLNYAIFEELETKDISRARQIYKTAIELVPHKQFTFAKIWLLFAKFEIRQLDLMAARKILGAAIGMCPKEALFKGYIQMELELREFDRARTLYEKYLEHDPTNCAAWIKFAELETTLDDIPRARAIFELGVSQPALDMPELLWKAYIDFEFGEGERENTRALYERLLEKTGNYKVWIAYALFEVARIGEDDEEEEDAGDVDAGDPEKARTVFERGYKSIKSQSVGLDKESDEYRATLEHRLLLLEAWKAFEEKHGTDADVAKVQLMMPKKVQTSWVYAFPDDVREANPSAYKFLQMAHAWRSQTGGAGENAAATSSRMDEDEDEDEDDEEDEDEGDDERDINSRSANRHESEEKDEESDEE
ncbi:NineTeen Complex (NTC) component, partial [Tulasnella sp. 418]